MTADQRSWPADVPQLSEQQSNGEIRFSPNFSVYVLPPDAVCLYSEDRKVFLRGELYCALASRIGAGERREALVSALSAEFPAVKINEALKRLIDRGFVGPANLIDGTAAGYWASLGLDAESAAENLAKIGVRIEPRAAAGASELDAALREFGVRVVDRLADLTVVLVDDYLDSKLADFNGERLAQKQEWLLAQPSGVFPLVGQPGKERLLDLPCRPPRRLVAWLPRHSPRMCLRKTRSDLRQSRSRRPSPADFAPTCTTTSSASTCWLRRSSGTMCQPGRSARLAVVRNCVTRRAWLHRSGSAPAERPS